MAIGFCASIACGQNLLPRFSTSAIHCDDGSLSPAGKLTFRQRTCYYTDRMLKPSLAIRAASLSGFDLWRDSPRQHADGMGSLGQRFSIFYAREAAQNTGELDLRD